MPARLATIRRPCGSHSAAVPGRREGDGARLALNVAARCWSEDIRDPDPYTRGNGSRLAMHCCGGAMPPASSTHRPTEEQRMWQKPEYSELRYGFEITMYICNR